MEYSWEVYQEREIVRWAPRTALGGPKSKYHLKESNKHVDFYTQKSPLSENSVGIISHLTAFFSLYLTTRILLCGGPFWMSLLSLLHLLSSRSLHRLKFVFSLVAQTKLRQPQYLRTASAAPQSAIRLTYRTAQYMEYVRSDQSATTQASRQQ